jgi:hypothetical protein
MPSSKIKLFKQVKDLLPSGGPVVQAAGRVLRVVEDDWSARVAAFTSLHPALVALSAPKKKDDRAARRASRRASLGLGMGTAAAAAAAAATTTVNANTNAVVMVGVEGGVFGVAVGGLASSPLEEQALKSSAAGEAWRALSDEGEALAKERRTVNAAVAYNAACIVQVSLYVLCLCVYVCMCVSVFFVSVCLRVYVCVFLCTPLACL